MIDTATYNNFKAANPNLTPDAQDYALMANDPIPVSSLTGKTMNTSSFPTATNMTPSYQSATTGAIASATTPAIDPYAQIKDLVSKQVAPESLVDTFKTLSANNNLDENQRQVNDLTASLNSIAASTTAGQLGLEGQDIRRSSPVLDKMQNEIARNNAIKALPISAALNAAQGRLQSAKDNINTLMGLVAKDQESKNTFEQNKINYALQFATLKQKDDLQARQEALDAKKIADANLNDLKNKYIEKALAVGDYATAGKLATATDEKTLSTISAGIKGSTLDDQYKKLQIQKLQQDINGGGTNPNALLSIADAKTLGVPYGTTVAEAIKKGVTPGQSVGNPMQLAGAKNNIDLIGSLTKDGNLNASVGPNSFGRMSFTNWATGGKSNFIAGVEQIVSQLSLDALINAKAQGATFGALSEGELSLLSNSASKISKWAVHQDPKDPTSPVVGYKASEKDFKAELDKINNFAKLDYILKGGTPTDVGAQQMADGTWWVMNSDGKTFTQLK